MPFKFDLKEAKKFVAELPANHDGTISATFLERSVVEKYGCSQRTIESRLRALKLMGLIRERNKDFFEIVRE